MKNAFVFVWMVSSSFASSVISDLGRGRLYDYLHVHHAPDPVNTRTGNFYLPMEDYAQPCFGYNIQIHRAYNSFYKKDGVFGLGWMFNYDMQVIFDRSSGIKIIEADGFITDYESGKPDTHEKQKIILQLVDLKKAEDIKFHNNPQGKGSTFYEDYKLKLSQDDIYFKKQKDLFLGADLGSGSATTFFTKQRIPSQLVETKTGFERTFENGKQEYYNKNGQLIKVEDKNKNVLNFFYQKNILNKVSDSCGQWLEFQYTPQNRISAIIDNYGRKLIYTYDKSGKLISSGLPTGEKIIYGYNALNLLNDIDFGKGETTKIIYDEKNQKVIQQIGPGKKITDYTYSKTPGMLSAGVKDNMGENILYQYSDLNDKVIFTDSSGKKTTTLLQTCCGKPLSILSEQGKGDTFTYDEKGRLKTQTDASGITTTFSYDERFGLPEKVEQSKGSYSQYRYDDKSNLIFVKNEKNEYIKLEHQKNGKISSMTNERGESVSFIYDAISNPILVTKKVKNKEIGRMEIKYNGFGEQVSKHFIPNDTQTENDLQNTLIEMFKTLEPVGLNLRF